MLLIAENCVPGQESPFKAFSFMLFQSFMYLNFSIEKSPISTQNLQHHILNTVKGKRKKFQSSDYATNTKESGNFW